MDNTKLDAELADLRAQLTTSAQPVKVEQPEVAEEVIPEKTEALLKQEDKQDELILGKFKSRDEADKAHLELEKELTRKSQELAELRKQISQPVSEPVAPVINDLDPLLKAILEGNKGYEEPAKAVPEENVQQPEPEEVDRLNSRISKLEKAAMWSILKQQEVVGKVKAASDLAQDALLPWSKEVEHEIETKVFKSLPQLRYQENGWQVAHKILKGEKAQEIAEVRTQLAVKAALEKETAKITAVVEPPTKSVEPTKQIDLKDLSLEDLKKYLAERVGVNHYGDKDANGIGSDYIFK